LRIVNREWDIWGLKKVTRGRGGKEVSPREAQWPGETTSVNFGSFPKLNAQY
jgi:hypothetical protein